MHCGEHSSQAVSLTSALTLRMSRVANSTNDLSIITVSCVSSGLLVMVVGIQTVAVVCLFKNNYFDIGVGMGTSKST